MAKSHASVDTAPPPAAPAVEPTSKLIGTFGRFAFVQTDGVPVDIKPTNRSSHTNPLPFREWFPNMRHQSEIFVPNSFWTAPVAEGGRGVKAADIKDLAIYAKGKVRDEFHRWLKADPEASLDHALLLEARKGGQDRRPSGTYPEDGLSVYMLIVPGQTAKDEALIARMKSGREAANARKASEAAAK